MTRDRMPTPPETPLALKARNQGEALLTRYPLTAKLLAVWEAPYSYKRLRFLAVQLSLYWARGLRVEL